LDQRLGLPVGHLELGFQAATPHLKFNIDGAQVLRRHAQANLPLSPLDLGKYPGSQGFPQAAGQRVSALLQVVSQVNGLCIRQDLRRRFRAWGGH